MIAHREIMEDREAWRKENFRQPVSFGMFT